MPKFDDEIRNFVNFQKLGYVATISSDGSPNLSPKGTIAILAGGIGFFLFYGFAAELMR